MEDLLLKVLLNQVWECKYCLKRSNIYESVLFVLLLVLMNRSP